MLCKSRNLGFVLGLALAWQAVVPAVAGEGKTGPFPVPPNGAARPRDWLGEGSTAPRSDGRAAPQTFYYWPDRSGVRNGDRSGAATNSGDTKERAVESYPDAVTTYNFESRVVTNTDHYGRTTTYVYDDAGRLITVIDPVGRAAAPEIAGPPASSPKGHVPKASTKAPVKKAQPSARNEKRRR